jgi:hypothetical protein
MLNFWGSIGFGWVRWLGESANPEDQAEPAASEGAGGRGRVKVLDEFFGFTAIDEV